MRQDSHREQTREGAFSLRRRWLRFLAAAGLLLSIGSNSDALAAGGDVVWQRSDALAGKQEAKAMAVDSLGSAVLVGYQNVSGGINDDFYTVKMKADGSGVDWRATYDKAGGTDQAIAVAIDRDDNIIVTGFAWNGLNNDIHTIKYNGATGEVMWQHTLNGAANGNDVGTSITVDSLNNVYVGGYTQDGTGNNMYIVAKYSPSGPNPDGSPVWTAIADGAATGINRVNSIAAGGGAVVVTGQTWNGSAFDMLTVKFDTAGTKVWERRFSTGPGKSCIGKYVKIDGSGNVIITGSANNGVDLDIYTAKYDGATGTILWERTYNGAFDDEPNALAIGPTGSVYLTGYTWTLTAQNDFYTAKLDGATGAVIWEKNFNSYNGNDDMTAATGIVVDPNGDVFVTGYTVIDKNFDFQTVKYKKDNGTQLWQNSFNGPAGKNDRPVGIGLSPTGEVIVGGWTDTAANDLDILAIKYDPGLLDPPTAVDAQTLSNTGIRVTWVDNSSNEDGFAVERCENSGCTVFTEIGAVAAGVTTFTDSGLTPNTYYTYRVRSFSSASGYSHYSNTATALTVLVNAVQPSWAYVYNGLANYDDFANAIAVGPDNNPVIAGQSNDYPTGYTSGVHSFDYLVVKLNRADMGIVWSDRYNDPNDAWDNATCIAVDRNNSVVVSGYATLSNSVGTDVNSLYTIRYPASGPPALKSDQFNAGGQSDDRAEAVAIASGSDTSNNVVVVGYGVSTRGDNDIYVLKYNPDGTRAWAAAPFNGADGNDHPTAVAIGADGSIYVTGYSETAHGTNIYNFFTAKYNGSTGVRIWTDLYSVTSGGNNRGNSLVVDKAGDLYVTGSAANGAGNADIHTIKYSGSATTPQRIWERSIDGAAHGDDQGVGVRIDPVDGTIVVAGSTLSSAGNNDFTVARYSPAGDTLGIRTYLRPATDDVATDMGIDSNGTIYVTGNLGTASSTDSMTVRFDYLGNVRSETVYNGAANSFDESSALAINSLDEVYVAGYTENAAGNADYLVYKISPDTSEPSVPFGIVATPGYATMTLAWSDKTSSPQGYRVERKTGACVAANTAPWEPLATTTARTFSDAGLNTGATYCYRLQTFVSSGAASRWVEKEAGTLTPPAPANVTATAPSSTTVTVGWTETITGETGFRVERCAGSGCTSFAPVGTAAANATTYADTSVCSGTAYRYRVLGVGSGWESAAGTQASTVTTPAPGIPVLTATRASEAEIQLSWTDPNTDETGHVVERCIGAGCTGFAAVVTLPANSTQYRDSGLTAGTAYTYRVKAYKTAGCPWETASEAKSATTTLVNPAGLTATAASTTSINLAWTDNTASETGFSVEKCLGSACDTFAEIASLGVNSSSFTDTAACTGETATYRVKAIRDAVTLSNSGDGCWTRRSSITLTGFQQNYQTRLTIPYDSDMLPAFDDIRFVDVTAGIELPYWIESKTDGASAVVWVKTAMNNAIYLYFGNGNAISSSNGSSVFDFFDDFAGTTLDGAKWGATGTYGIADGSLRIDTGSVYTKATIVPTPQNRVFEMKSQWLTGAASYSGINIANSQSTQGSNAGSNALAYFVTDSGTTANLLPFAANGTAASYNIVSGAISTTVSTGGALYNPFVSNNQNTRKPASGVWSPPQGGNITRIHVRTQTEACCDPFRVYNASGTLLGEWRGTVDTWIDISPTSGIYTVFQTDYSVNGGFGGDVPEVVTAGSSAVGQLNTYRITGYEFKDTSQIGFFVKNPDYSQVFRSDFNGTWTAAPYLWLGYYSGASAGTVDIDDMVVDWVRVRKYAAAEPVAAIGAKEASDCFTFGSPWTGSYTNTATASTPAPGVPVLTAQRVSEVQINLSWTDVASDESGYKVERCTGEGCSNFAPVAVRSSNVTSFADTGLTPGATYSYRVKAYKSTTCSWETTSNVATQTTTLTGPANVVATAVDTTRISLSWTNTTANETSFSIERCEGVGCGDFVFLASAPARSVTYTDTTPCTGRTYSYRIKGVSTAPVWETTPSNVASAVTPSSINILPDAGFENATTAWTTAVGTLTGTSFDTTIVKDGTRSLKLTAAGATLGRAQSVAVTPGRSYVLSGWINASLTSGKAQCDVMGTGIDSPGIGIAAGTADNNAGWVNLSETVTIPAGTSSISVRCFADGSPAGTAHIDGISLAPTDFLLTATRASELAVNLSWLDGASDETGYRIERCEGSGCTVFTEIGTVGANVTAYTNSGLAPNTTYRYQIRGYKTSTCGWYTAYSAIGEAVTTPAAPAFLTGTASNTTQINLAWTDATASETGFEIERCTGAACSTFAKINTTGANANFFYDTTVSSGTTYRYRVRAVSTTANWTTAYSGEVSATTPSPAVPVLSATAPNEVTVNLSWTDPTTDETGYKVYRCGGATCTDFSVIATLGANVAAYSDTGRTANATYSYKVEGYKTGTGAWTTPSLPVVVTTTAQAPATLAVTAVDTTQTRLTWVNKTTSHTGISIERCQGTGCSTFSTIATVGTGVASYYDTTLCNNQPTTYRVQAINTTVPWTSDYSNTAGITLAAPAAPSALTATRANETQINLAWTDNTTDETGFRIERCAGTGCSNFAEIKTVLPNVKTYNDTALTPNTTYRYQVKAYKTPSLGCGWESVPSTAGEAATTVAAPTTFVATAVNSTTVNLTWVNNTVSETGYKIERCTGAGCSSFAEVAVPVGKATSWTDTSVASSTSYTYRIRATSSAVSWDSPYSATSTAATPAQGAPSNLTGGGTTTSIALAWADNTVDETAFIVEKCAGAGCSNFSQVASLGANVTTYTDDSVCNGQSYTYRVRATSTVVPYDTPYSTPLTVTPPVPAPPVATAARNSEVQIGLTWTDPTTDETGYKLERCTGSGCTDFATVTQLAANTTSFIDTGLVPETIYTYRIKGYKNAACSWETTGSTASAQASVVAPTGLTATAVNTTRIDLSWTDTSTSKTGFRIERCAGGSCSNFSEIATTGTATTWSDTSVASGTAYSYRVRATRDIPYAWNSGYSNTASASTPAAPAPTTLSATTASNSQINLAWVDTASDETGYRVERCTGADCGDFSEISTTAPNASTYSSTGLAASGTYCFRVRGYKTGTSPWTSPYSNTACATTSMDAPATLTATAVNSFTVKLAWMDTSSGEGGFTVEQQVWNGEWVAVSSVGPNITSYTDSIGIEPNKRYSYRIKAFRGAENSAYSNTATVTTPAYKAEDTTCEAPVTGAPTFTSQPVTTAIEGVDYTYQAVATAEGGGPVTYVLTTRPSGMAISGSGNVTWTPEYTQAGTQNVTIRVTDSLGRTADQSFTITVANTNRPPAFNSTASTSATESHPYRYDAVANDPDGTPITLTLTTKPDGMGISGTGAVSWTPSGAQIGSHPVVIEAASDGLTTTQSFTITVSANRAPSISSTATTVAAEGRAYTYQVTASDADNDPLTYRLTTAPAGMTVSPTGLVTWAPSLAQLGANAVTLEVSDGSLSTTQSFTVTVEANHAPAVTSTPVTTGSEGAAYTYAVVATDSDGDPVTYSLKSYPAGMTISAAGVVTWTPAYTQSGTYAVTVRVTDARSLSTDHSYSLTVADVPKPPVISSTPPATALMGTGYTYQVVATDPGGMAITYGLTAAPAGMNMSSTGLVSWTPSAIGTYPVTIRVANNLDAAIQSYTLAVAAAPAAPTLITQAGINTGCATSTAHTLTWNAATVPDSDPAQYYVQMDTSTAFNSGNLKQSGWVSGTSWTTPVIPNGTWYWRVKARDSVHGAAESAYSPSGSFADTTDAYTCGLCGYWDCTCDNTCGSSSCPLVYSWNGGYHYETDLQGPAISQIKKGSRYVYLYQPSYVVLENGLTPDENNQYKVKIWESLQEASIIDEAKLIAVDHPAGYQIVSSGAENTYYYAYANPFRVYTIKDPVLPLAASDKNGNDVLPSVSAVDNTVAPMNPEDPDNYYTFDFGPIAHPENAKLVIDGWQDINSKLYLSTIQIQPYVEVIDSNGEWVNVKSFGMPAGDLKTMVVDMSGLFRSSDHRVRLHLGIKKAQVWVFDRIRLDDSAPVAVTMQMLQPTSANLQNGGHAIQSMVDREHRLLATDDVQPLQPTWYGYGNFTRYGDILPLLTQRDDKFALLNYADKLEVTFPVPLPPPAGSQRSFVLMVDNYYKEFKEYKYLEPLPFHGMSDYPYPSTESYPADADHEQYRQEYNTRIVTP